jgi:hypothetical protein
MWLKPGRPADHRPWRAGGDRVGPHERTPSDQSIHPPLGETDPARPLSLRKNIYGIGHKNSFGIIFLVTRVILYVT